MSYRIGSYGVEDGRPTLFRQNDGSLVIMTDEEGRGPVLIVPRVHPVKRVERWSADDADQLVFAQKVVDLLNGAA